MPVPVQPVGSDDKLPASVDVVVIGAGMAGSAASCYLAKKGHSAEDVDKMYGAWVKACLLQVTLWSHPYVKDGDF